MSTIEIPSQNIQLYPSAYRGVADNNALFNPEARIPSELNITNQTNNFGRVSFIISPTDTTTALSEDNYIIFVIHGYWFKLTLTSEMLNSLNSSNSGLYAQITLEDKNSSPTPYEYAGTVLKSYHSTNNTPDTQLDYKYNDDFYFSGLKLQNSSFTDGANQFSIKLLTDEQKIPAASLLRIDSKNIANNEKQLGEYISINDRFDTNTNNSNILNTCKIDGLQYSNNSSTIVLGKTDPTLQTLSFIPTPGDSNNSAPKINFGNSNNQINEIHAKELYADNVVKCFNIIECDDTMQSVKCIIADKLEIGNLAENRGELLPYIGVENVNIGSSSNRFNSIYGKNIYGENITCTSTISGSSITATTVTASSFTATSDIRLKENIKDYICERSILDLPIKEFDFKESKQHAIGCIAQDLKEICPEIVHENEEGFLTIEENKLVYLLIQEVKKLKQEIENLK